MSPPRCRPRRHALPQKEVTWNAAASRRFLQPNESPAFFFSVPAFSCSSPPSGVRLFSWACLCFSSGHLATPSANATHSITSNPANTRRPRSFVIPTEAPAHFGRYVAGIAATSLTKKSLPSRATTATRSCTRGISLPLPRSSLCPSVVNSFFFFFQISPLSP